MMFVVVDPQSVMRYLFTQTAPLNLQSGLPVHLTPGASRQTAGTPRMGDQDAPIDDRTRTPHIADRHAHDARRGLLCNTSCAKQHVPGIRWPKAADSGPGP